MITAAIQTLATRTNLEELDAIESFKEILEGSATEAQTAAFLTALLMKGETPEELTYFLKALEETMEFIEPKVEGKLLHVSGTGGDILGTFHISTTSCFVAAAAGCNVTKHITSRLGGVGGSAELLQELGANLNVSLPEMKTVIEETGLGFLYVPLHVKKLGEIDAKIQLGLRNALTLLSALVTPVKAERRMVGTYSVETAELLARTLQLQNVEHGLALHGLAGLDEISNLGETRIFEFMQGMQLQEKTITPEHFNFNQTKIGELMAGTPKENAVITKGILEGARGAKSDIVLLNAGAMIYVSGLSHDFTEGVAKAKETVSSGTALKKMNQFIEATKKYSD
jgi:anthranilate phosphoribosyltransferase